MTYKYDSTYSAVKMLQKELPQFTEDNFYLLAESQTRIKRTGKLYREYALWVHNEKEEFTLYNFETYVNAKGSLGSDGELEKKYFSSLNDFYKWAKADNEKLFSIASKYCIVRSKNSLEEALPDKMKNKKHIKI